MTVFSGGYLADACLPADKAAVRRLPPAALPVIALVAGAPGVVAPGSVFAQATYTIAFALFVVVSWLGVRRRTGRARVAYGLLAGALTAWLGGDLLYTALSLRPGGVGDVSAADVLWVGGYPLVAAGMVVLVRLRAPGRLREAALDMLAMAIVVAALFWSFLAVPLLTDGELSLEVLLGLLYPFGDVLLFAAGALVVLAPGERTAATRCLMAALALTLAGDVGISAIAVVFPDFDSAPLDALLLLANGLLAAGLWHPGSQGLADSGEHDLQRLHPARVIFLGVALLALPAINEAHVRQEGVGRYTLLAAMVVLTVIVLIRFTLVVRDQERVRAALAHRATHDQLTGLVNRPELHARLTAALEQRPAGGPVVHFLDLNGFKPINDRYGHAAGDHVLIEVARRLRTAVRAGDTVARLGGDEFVVVSGDEGAEDAAAFTDRLRAAVTAPLHFQGHEFAVGVSIGRAGAPAGPTSSDALLAAADASMYREKTATRSRV